MTPPRYATDERYRELLDLAPVPMFVDRDGEILYANGAGGRLLGARDPDDLVGESVFRFVAPQEEGAVRRRIRRVEESGEATSVEDIRLVRLDGDERLGTVRSIPVTVDGGAASLSIIRDVTSERRALRALEESERRFRTLFEDTHDAVYRTTRAGEIVQANRAMLELFGLERDELEGLQAAELYADPDDRERFREAIAASGYVKDFEVRLRRRDGEVRTCLITATTWRDADGEVGGYQGMIRDVTERRRLEGELREREKHYRRLVEAVGVVPWELRLEDWTFTYVAPQVEDVFGYPREAWYEPGFWPDHLHPDDREEAVRFCARQTRRGRDHEFEYRFLHAKGHAVWVQDIVSVVESDDGTDLLRGVMIDITDRKRFERQLEEQALRDELTGLPNRTLFWDRLEHALARARREGSELAVLFVDVDRFKLVNDSLGHAAGDQVLVEVARRLDGAFREEDTVARFGGDEFAVIMEDVTDEGPAEEAARRFLRDLEEPVEVAGEPLHLTASVGVALMPDVRRAGGGDDAGDELVRRADAAMFRAKKRPGDAVHVLDPEEDVEGEERLHREQELRDGIERDEFRVVFQPVVRLDDGRIVGCEALARWQHPDRGLVSPADFIPLAEESGLIVPLGRKLLEQACTAVAGWEASGVAPDGLTLCFNLSVRQFEDPGLQEAVQHVLAATGLTPGHLCFEVTERLVMRGYERVDQVRRLGVGIAIDDFGTGYSSLHYLKRLEVDGLKIDRSFVAGVGGDYRDDAIVRTIVTLGETLDLQVIAEGIERPEQRRALMSYGCGLGQGFHFAHPMRPESLEEMLADGASVGRG